MNFHNPIIINIFNTNESHVEILGEDIIKMDRHTLESIFIGHSLSWRQMGAIIDDATHDDEDRPKSDIVEHNLLPSIIPHIIPQWNGDEFTITIHGETDDGDEFTITIDDEWFMWVVDEWL